MKLNIYKNQNEIEKTYEVDSYDLMYGTVEDILQVLDEVNEKMSDVELFNVISRNRTKLNDLLLDIFPDMTKEELRNIKLKELVPFFIDLFTYVKDSFGKSKN